MCRLLLCPSWRWRFCGFADDRLDTHLVIVESVAVYIAVLRAMRKPVAIGKEQILRAMGVVVSAESDALVVRVQGERWTARSADESLRPRDGVRVVGIDGLDLRVTRDPDESPPPVHRVPAR